MVRIAEDERKRRLDARSRACRQSPDDTCAGSDGSGRSGTRSAGRATRRRAARPPLPAGEDRARPGDRDRAGTSPLAALEGRTEVRGRLPDRRERRDRGARGRAGSGDAGALLGDLVPPLPAGDPEPARLRRRSRRHPPQARPGGRRRRARPRGRVRRQSALPGALRSGLGCRPPLPHHPAPRDPPDPRRQDRSELHRRGRLAATRRPLGGPAHRARPPRGRGRGGRRGRGRTGPRKRPGRPPERSRP